MAKNTVQNAKTAARKVLSAVVGAVAGGKKGKDVTPKKKDTPDTSAVSTPKKGKKKTADLSVPRNGVGKSVRKSLHKAVDPDSVSTAVNVLGRGANRANVFGHSASAVWRALGGRKVKGEYVYTVSDAKAVRDGLGLGDVITDTNVKCQFGDGRGRANGNDPLYGGTVADLTPKDWAVVDGMVKAAREDS